MADIKQLSVNNVAYDIKDEVARNGLLTKQDVIERVTASADSNVGTPSVTPTWNNGTLDFAFHNVKGEQGVKGDTVILGDEEEYTLYNTTGNNTDGAMTQKSVTAELNKISIPTSDESDLDIADESGNSIVRFENGHIKTKNFDSSHIDVNGAAICGESSEIADLDIVDENDYSIVRFQNGHIKTKNFDSETLNLNTYDSSSKSITATADSLSSGDSMSINNPDIKNHYMLSFTASVNTMGTLSIEVGSSGNYESRGKVEITPTTVVIYEYRTWNTTSIEHGLAIVDNISVIIQTKDFTFAELTIMTSDGEQKFTRVISWAGCSSGCAISNAGGSYEDCTFIANYYGVLKDVWIFGDSYLGRLTRILQGMGYFNYLLDGFSGRNSAQGLASFQKDIVLGKPKVVVWQLGMNDADSGSVNSAWKTAFDTMVNYCRANDIEFICCTIPNVPQRNHTYKNAYMNGSGVRLIDIAAELGATESNSTWYPGLLGTDNVHPTMSGAMRIALAFLSNIACITQ